MMQVGAIFSQRRIVVLGPALRALYKAEPAEAQGEKKYPPLQPGDRWVTLSPNGPDAEPKIRVVIRQHPSDPAKWVVVSGAGAGGKGRGLRGMQLTNVASKEEWEKRRKERQVRRREERQAAKEERERRVAAGEGATVEAEERAEEELKEARRKVEREFIEQVAAAHGWEDWDIKEEELEGKKESVAEELRRRHHRRMLTRARREAREVTHEMALDTDLRRAAATAIAAGDEEGLAGGERELATEILADLSAKRPGAGPGYAAERRPRLAGELEEAGELTVEQVRAWRAEAESAAETALEEAGEEGGVAMLRAHAARQVASAMAEAEARLAAGDVSGAAYMVARREGIERRLQQQLARAEEEPQYAEAYVARVTAAEDWRDQVKLAASETGVLDRVDQLEDTVKTATQKVEVMRAARKLKLALRSLERDAEALAEHGLEASDLPALAASYVPNPIRLQDIPDEEADAMWQEDVEETAARLAFSEFVDVALGGTRAEGLGSIREAAGWSQEDYARAVYPHISGGAYAAYTTAMQNLTGGEGIDRDTVDLLGTEKTAELLSWRLRQNLTPEQFNMARERLAAYQEERTRDVRDNVFPKVDELMQQAEAMKLPDGENPEDLILAQQMNEMRMAYITDAVQVLGNAWGDVHAVGQLVGEMQKKLPANHRLSVGLHNMSYQDAVAHARGRLGLSPDEFEVGKEQGQTVLTIKAAGLDRLTGLRSSPEALEAAAELTAIKRGQRDVAGWLPAGISRRAAPPVDAVDDPATYYNLPDLRGKTGKGLRQGIEDVAAALYMATGGDVAAARAGLYSSQVAVACGVNPETYERIVSEMFPVTPDGRHDDAARETMVAAARRIDGELAGQAIPMATDEDQERAYDAVHEAVANIPAMRLAFSDVRALSRRERRELMQIWSAGRGLTPDESREAWRAHAKEAGGPAAALAAVISDLRADLSARVAGRYAGALSLAEAETPEGKRKTLGPTAERQLEAIMADVGPAFQRGQRVKLARGVSMDGAFIVQQRMVKAIESVKRLGMWAGAGSGKTVISFGAFTDLHAQGKVKRGLYIVPSGVLGQFGSEAARFLEPGKFHWHAQPGASRAERMAAYADPETHMCVVTHTAIRDDITEALAEIRGIDRAAARNLLNRGTREDRRARVGEVCKAKGWRFDFMYIDEAHRVSNRKGKRNSWMANVTDALGDHSEYLVLGTGTPVKNDTSELFDMLHKLDPQQFTDRAAFLRRYGENTVAAREALRKLTARYFYASAVHSQYPPRKAVRGVRLSPWQKKEQRRILDAYGAAQLAHRRGEVNVEAVRTLHPAAFEGLSKKDAGRLAARLQRTAGALRDTALRRVLLAAPAEHNAKAQEVVQIARRKEPGVVFSGSLAGVDVLRDALTGAGKKVLTITGEDSTPEKDRRRVDFTEGQADVLVCSNAAAEGLNLQRGKWLVHYDVPMTNMVHEQRSHRIDRIGQDQTVDIYDLVARGSPLELQALRRVRSKAELGGVVETADEMDDTGIAAYLRGVVAQAGAPAAREAA